MILLLSLSLSLSLSANLNDGLVEICVYGSCMGQSEFVFVIWFSIVRRLTFCGLIANLMPENWWLCDDVCGQKQWKSLEGESGLLLGWKRGI